jgi:hypothetical protein
MTALRRRKLDHAACAGEHWDNSEEMDTYYNPIPHFTYQMALDHSPTLKNVRRLTCSPYLMTNTYRHGGVVKAMAPTHAMLVAGADTASRESGRGRI